MKALVGVANDPALGPLIVCGMGGVMAELIKDVAFRLHPVSDIDAGEMIGTLRSSRLLEGFRGSPKCDRGALISAILKISALVEAVPEIAELDLNPISIQPEGKGAVVIDARMRLHPASYAARIMPLIRVHWTINGRS